MDEHPNVKAVREADEKARATGDMAVMAEVMADDIAWHEIGRDEPTVGMAALADRMQNSSMADTRLETETHAIVGDDEHVVQLVNVTATRNGRTFHYRTAEIYHMRDGKITARWAFSDDTAAILDFFA